ncbi:Cytochrome P450 family protein [Quillaja saponaria]|uniref:Cytochrome P450 family protein n=1 Tax=Quillaja saponaria TaxID=32244 RepID=A0AAD7Q4J5_QUISA|nr:Cytochrome P450 family protein [Quillaja saponaria]
MLGYTEILIAFLSILFLLKWIRYRNSPVIDWPFLGMLPGISRNAWRIHDYVTLLLKHHGGTMEIKGPWFTNMNFVLTSDPMNVQHITGKNSSNYPRGSEYREILEPSGDGIFNTDDEIWRNNRTMVHSLIKQRKFEFLVEQTIQKKLDSCLIPVLNYASEKARELDLEDVIERFTFDNICSMVLGFDPKCLSIEFPKVAYEKAFNEMEKTVLHRHIMPRSFWKLQKWLQIGQEKKLSAAKKILDQFIHERIAFKREEQRRYKGGLEVNDQEKEPPPFDLLTAYIEEEEKGEMGDKFLRDSAFNLLVAGRDTLSAGFTWFFWHIATHPSVATKILEEIKCKFAPKEGEWRVLSTDEVGKLVYLHAAIFESLRLFPPVPYLHVCTINSDVLPSGYRINPKTKVFYSLYAMGRTQEIWGEDYLEFKPERWISEDGGIKHIPSYKFIAFNAGPRSCLGKDTSITEMKMVASAIIWNYDIQVVEGHHVSPSDSVILHMKHGLKVKIIKRCI